MSTIKKGSFVRVKSSSDFRADQDAMAVEDDDGSSVALIFGTDRYNRHQEGPGSALTGLVELWDLSELDLQSVE